MKEKAQDIFESLLSVIVSNIIERKKNNDWYKSDGENS